MSLVVDGGGVNELVPDQLIGGPGTVHEGHDPPAASVKGDDGADLASIGFNFFGHLIELKI